MSLGDGDGQWNDTVVYDIFWYAPEVRRWVRLEHRYERRERVARGPRIEKDWIVWQLASYTLADWLHPDAGNRRRFPLPHA